MQTTWNWIKENGGPLATIATLLVAITILFQFGVLNPILQRFDAWDQRIDDLEIMMNQRFDAVDQRLEGLENDVSELRKIDDRVSRNEGQIDVIRQQLQTVDTPSPAD